MSEITSPHNPKYKCWLSLLEAKGIKKHGLCLVSGAKLIEELAAQKSESLKEVLLPPKGEPLPGIPGRQQTRLSSPLFRELDTIGTKSPLAVFEVPEIPAWDPSGSMRDGLQLVLALSDPSNLGACLRSAEAFSVQRVILTQECSSPFLPRALRASSGSAFRVPLARSHSPLGELEFPSGTSVLGLDMEGESLLDFKWPDRCFLVLGEEGQGLPTELITRRLSIPMNRTVESLNATVAASIAMFSYRAKIRSTI